MKKTLALILAVVMIAAAMPFAVFAGRFIDVEDGKWYSEAIDFCAANGYMDGVGGDRFDRKANLTRAMFVVILAGIDGVDLAPYEEKTPFTDVVKGKWYTAAVAWASENEITSGIGGGLFGYKNNITREQIALLLYTYSAYKNLDVAARADITTFSDHGKTHDWALEAMKWAVASELLSGTGAGLLDPRGLCTREQTAVIIHAYVLKFLSECEHEWVEPNCTEEGYCSKCGIKSGTALGHDKGDVSCTAEAPCIRCGETVAATDHIPAGEATCTEAALCSVCGHEAVPALGHTTSNGVCDRCGTEIFATAHDKLVHYLNTKGLESSDGDKCFYREETIDGQEFESFVYLTPGESDVHLRTEVYDPATGKLDYLEVTLHNSNGLYYELISGSFTGETIHFQMTGGFTAPLLDGYGDFEVLSYYGEQSDYALALVTSNYLLVYTVNAANELMTENASVSLAEYGYSVPLTIVK